jgi:hypothetical protein
MPTSPPQPCLRRGKPVVAVDRSDTLERRVAAARATLRNSQPVSCEAAVGVALAKRSPG